MGSARQRWRVRRVSASALESLTVTPALSAPRAERGWAGSAMLTYIVRRILATIPVMAVVALFVFSLLYLSPGDPAAIIAGDIATVEDIVRIRAQARPRSAVPRSSSARWVWALLQGDLGISIFTNLPVTKLIAAARRADRGADDLRR